MNGYKGFGIITLVLLLLAFAFLSFGSFKANSETEDKKFEEEYQKSIISKIDYSVEPTFSVMKRTGQDELISEKINSPYLMADLHRHHFYAMFSYHEEKTSILEIDKVIINDKFNNEFIQDDEVLKNDPNKSFVVIDLGGGVLLDKGDIKVKVFFKENTLNIEYREFILRNNDINTLILLIKEDYEKYKENEVEL